MNDKTVLTREEIELLDGLSRAIVTPITASVYDHNDGGPPAGALHGPDTSYEATLCEFWSGEHNNEGCVAFVAALINAWPQLRDMALASLSSDREEVIEECAKVCEDERVDADATGDPCDHAYNTATEHCAKAIRALAASETQQSGG